MYKNKARRHVARARFFAIWAIYYGYCFTATAPYRSPAARIVCRG